jgi:acyl-CoA reductase-like NAD-dependent aldehyde dehydrogenase
MQSAAGTLKRITLELGGNDPAIVCEDVDIETTAQKVATIAFANSGQVCLAIKRIYIQDTIFTEFRDAMVKHTKTLKLGDGLDRETSHGPVQNAIQYERVQGFLKDVESEKWNVAAGGEKSPHSKGYFITPTIIDSPPDDSRIVIEEPFGKPRWKPISSPLQPPQYRHLNSTISLLTISPAS